MTEQRNPSPAQAARRLRRIAKRLRFLKPGEYDQERMSSCVIGHAREIYPEAGDIAVFLGLSHRDSLRLFPCDARVRDAAGKAAQLEAIAKRLDARNGKERRA